MDDLKPCPFCGEKGEIIDHAPDSMIGKFEAGCVNNDCPIADCSINKYFQTMPEAIAAWNTRAPIWQPIETAPRDVAVLLYRNECWVAAKIHGANGPGWCTPDGMEIFRPTHWMPLPTPPDIEEG